MEGRKAISVLPHLVLASSYFSFLSFFLMRSLDPRENLARLNTPRKDKAQTSKNRKSADTNFCVLIFFS